MKEIKTNSAPTSIGPFSQGIVSGDRIYVSGQGPIDPDSDEIVSEDVKIQTEQTLQNIGAILQVADCSLAEVVKANIFLTDMADYDAVNEVYAKHMTAPYPARSAVEVRDLPVDISVEIEVIAETDQ